MYERSAALHAATNPDNERPPTDVCPACGAEVAEGVPHVDHVTTYTTGAEASPPVPTNFVIACSCGKRIGVASLSEAFVIASAERHVAEALQAEKDARGEQDCGCVYRVTGWTVTDELRERCDHHERDFQRGDDVNYDGTRYHVDFAEGDTIGLMTAGGSYFEVTRDDERLTRWEA